MKQSQVKKKNVSFTAGGSYSIPRELVSSPDIFILTANYLDRVNSTNKIQQFPDYWGVGGVTSLF